MWWKISLVLVFLAMAWGDPVLNKLDLSPAQVQRIREQRAAYRAEQKELTKQIQKKQQELKELLQAEHPDEKSIKKTTAELNELKAKLNEKRVDAALKVRQELTKEQHQELMRLQEQRAKRQLLKQRRNGQNDNISAEERKQ